MKQGINVRKLGVTILTCFVLLFPVSARAVTYYVDIQNGTDDISHGGSSGTGAWKTLHYAVDQIGDGDTLNVAAGTYIYSNGESDTDLIVTQSNVIIQGAPGGASIVDGYDDVGLEYWNTGIIVDAFNVTVKGLTLRNFTSPGEGGIRIVSGAGNIIEGCNVYNNDEGIRVVDSSPEIERNRIYDNMIGISVAPFSGTASPKVWNNLIYDITESMEIGISIVVTNDIAVASPQIYHNTLDGGTDDGIYMYRDYGVATPDIQYNIITNFGFSGINNSGSSASPIIDYNNVWNNAGGNYSGTAAGTHDLSPPQNPLYASYALQSTSPCIDAIPSGVGDPVDNDIDGNTRPQGNGSDMGAYEFPVATSEMIPIPPGTEVPEYIMVSFTVRPDDPSCNTVFGDDMGGAYDPQNHRIGGYDATLGGYRECPDGLTIEPGHAYWMLARDGLTATVDGIPASLNDTEVPLLYSAATGDGWNQIASPNPASYAWEDVEVVQYDAGGAIVNGPTCIFDLPSDNPMIDKRLWRWDAGSYLDDTSTLVQGEGYWVRARASNVSLIFLQSVQLAQVSDTSIMLADLWSGIKRWARHRIFGPRTAVADSGDTPPMPMGGMAAPVTEEGGGGGGGCLIDATARGFLGR
jgi:parallel beta-helix repeat protein